MEITMRQAALFLVLILAAALAHADDVPKRKPGLWEVKWTASRTADKLHVLQMCVDPATDGALQHLSGGVRKETCKFGKVGSEGDRITIEAVCKRGKTTVTTQAVITGKLDSAYKVESKSKYDPPRRGTGEGTTSQEARWLGPCKSDQKPGDVMLASGNKFNVNDKPSNTSPKGKSGPTTSTPTDKRSSSKSKPASSAPTQ
jgi:Protein of unknown function (DUF3617)